MNTLRYITLSDAAARPFLDNGTVVIAHMAAIETTKKTDAVLAVESSAGSQTWKRVYGKTGSYYYELLVARDGVTPLLDDNGDQCGFKVNGTNRGRS